MNLCNDCGETIRITTNSFQFKCRCLGNSPAPNVYYDYQCLSCGNKFVATKEEFDWSNIVEEGK